MQAVLRMLFFCALVFFYAECDVWGDITISGATTVQGVAEKVGAVYAAASGTKVAVKGGGSGAGLKNALEGVSDIGMVSRALKDDEKSKLNYLTCAYDALVIIVNTDNPIKSIDRETVVKIFSGAVAKWADINGWTEKILLVSKEKGRATLDLFEGYAKLHHPEKPAGPAGHISKTAYEIGANIEAITIVGGLPGAIGYVSLGAANQMIAKGTPIRILELDGVTPDIPKVVSGKYPISRELNFVFKERNEKISGFLDAVLSPEAQKIVAGEGFIPIEGAKK